MYFSRVFIHKARAFFVVLFSFFIFVAVLQLNYFAVYQEFISPMGFGFASKNFDLTVEYFFENVVWIRSLLAIVLLSICARLAFKFITTPPETLSFSKKSRISAVSLAFVGVTLFIVSVLSWFFVPEFLNYPVAFTHSYVESLSRTSRSFAVNRPPMPVLKDNKDVKIPSIVFVVGESATLSHFSLYGYERKTTPLLEQMRDRNDMVALKNAVSVGHRTMLSVPYMLFGLKGPDPLGRIYSYPSLFNYAKSREMSTALISAQDLRWYNVDKLIVDESIDVYKTGTNFTPNVTVSIGADDMDVFNNGVKPFLEKTKEPYFLVIQMNGSHYPYSAHSPENFKVFLPEEKPNSVNAYDNTIYYLDYYLNELVAAVRQKTPDAWIFYSTDHGQNVGEDKKFNSGFDLNVVHNPLLVFPPKEFVGQIQTQIEAPVSQADIAKTILELIQVDPMFPIEGESLLHPIDPKRLRVTSAYMPTFSNEPTGVLFFPNLEAWKIDFSKRVFIKPDDTVQTFDESDANIRKIIRH